ncbi:MAG: hypothetical protein DMF41_09760 [Verrucomicrobia bacterium]|nr:MAG: hypothetical protein DMF41_09760 [Verrucomicrobiota bacterium]
MGVRSPIAKSDQAHAEKTFRLGWHLDRQRQYSFSQPRPWRKGRFDLSNVDRRKKFETRDQERAFSIHQQSARMKRLTFAIFLCVALSGISQAAQRKMVLPNIPSDNCFGPVWSPDGSKLAFSIMADKAWQLGLVNADGSAFRFVKNAELRPEAFGASEWARDGKSIFCHDLDNIYQIDLDGNVLNKWELSKILTDASMNGGDRLSVSPDGKALLMDVDCGSEHERKNWDGPQPAIYKFDLTSEKAVRVTGKDDFVWEPFWLSANEFLCIIQKENENRPSIYRMSLDGKNPKLLVKHARTPSASAQ